MKEATIDANEAVAYAAYRMSEVIAIYPITPSSAMGEWADAWSSENQPNLWGTVPRVIELQSEGGAAGTIHGAIQTGSLATTFTASQGLLLMIPNMYKIAGELTPVVFHVAARALAAQGLSIFGDHSDVMAARGAGFALLCSNSVQEAADFATVAHLATLEARIPFLHFFDGFRTSHEVAKVELLADDEMLSLVNEARVFEHRARRLTPDRPVIRGTAQNPDVYFQARESSNPFYERCPDITQLIFDKFAKLTGRKYRLYEYYGHPEAERVIVVMGSGADVTHETVDWMLSKGERIGVVKVRLFRPFDSARFLEAFPRTVRSIAVLDRTKEPGSVGEPLYLDTVAAFSGTARDRQPLIVGGRYGLASKEFTPAMVRSVFDHIRASKPSNHFTVGINDDVTHSSLTYDPKFSLEPDTVIRALFYGLGSDGTVGANKGSIKILGSDKGRFAQGYFVYDSKKSGAMTVSHLRFGPQPIRSSYLINGAHFIGCHQWNFLERHNVLEQALDGGVFLLNSPFGPTDVWEQMPEEIQAQIIKKRLKFYVIDAFKVAREAGMGGRINTVMQVCFFAISNVLPRDEAIAAIKHEIEKTYAKKGEEIVKMNFAAVDATLVNLHEVKVPSQVRGGKRMASLVSGEAPEFVGKVLACMIGGKGDDLPVSALPTDGTYPVGTAQYEKRNLAREIPVWEPEICIQCGKCSFVCPHSVIRIKVYESEIVEKAPQTFKSMAAKDREFSGLSYTIQVSPEDCTGCGICVDICPARSKSQARTKAINMKPQPPIRETEKANWEFFLKVPDMDRRKIDLKRIRQQQLETPLFEFSSACAGCGETPYLKLATQLFGDRMVVANATGCSSIYGGNLPTTPWSKNEQGRGPAWSNSLFEDNAEFGLGFRISIDKQKEMARELMLKLSSQIGDELVSAILGADQLGEAGIWEQRDRVQALRQKIKPLGSPDARRLGDLADMLVKKSVWIVGGDGWAYDIGFGGLDHVLSSGRDVNILVLDTEVYSNTGGQVSKSTPKGAVAKFAAGGKPFAKKDLGLLAISYANVYVAKVAMGARDEHTLKAFLEAESYPGVSLIIAYSHCIAHGINMATAMQNQKTAVEAGHWMLYRYNPLRAASGENALQIDSREPELPIEQFFEKENRFRMLQAIRPDEARRLFKEAQKDAEQTWLRYQAMAGEPKKTE